MRQYVQDFINRRMIDQGKARATVAKQVSGIRSYWNYLVSLDELLRERRPFADLIWPTAKSTRRKPTDPNFISTKMMGRASTRRWCHAYGTRPIAASSLTCEIS